jgi:glycosyltransferase involved in cell wall biosynthesis
MRIVWVTWFFLDYRIPVFEELCNLEDVEFYLLYNGDIEFGGINEKIKSALGNRVIPMTGAINLSYKFTSGVANKGFRIPYQPGLVKIILQLKPDVMVSDGFFQWTYAPLFLRATRGIPHVMCYERTSHTERNAQLIRRLYRKAVMRWIDAICCSGKLCGEYVASLGYSRERTTFGHMVGDTEQLRRKPIAEQKYYESLKSKLGLSETVYLYVGRIHEMKGIFNMVSAWRDFISHIADKPSLLIIGSGELDHVLKSEISDHGLNTVKFIGRIDYDDIADYYHVANIFILPTLEDNWSLVVPEAMASGLPIITSIYNGCWPELVQESNGWVMDPLNHDNFVETLVESYKARAKFKKMGEASLEIIREYTPKSAAGNILETCKMAIELQKKRK